MRNFQCYTAKAVFRICVLSACFLAVLSFSLGQAFAANNKKSVAPIEKNVLYVSAFTPSYAWDIGIISHVKKSLAQIGAEIHYYEEFLDIRNIDARAREQYFSQLAEVYRQKYAYIPIDLIIVNVDTEFMLRYGKAIFPHVPMIFCALESTIYNAIKNTSNVNATIDTRTPRRVMHFMAQSMPHAEHIVVIADSSVGSKIMVPQIMALEQDFSQFHFSYIYPKDEQELVRMVKSAPPNSLLLDTSYFSSPPIGALLHKDRKAPAYEASGLPLFTVWNKAVGFGAIAGQEVPVDAHGAALGALAISALTRGTANALAPVIVRNTPLLVDYAMLKHFNLLHVPLDGNTHLLNKPVSFYATHKVTIHLFAVFFALAALCIGFLLVALQKKRLEKKYLVSALENQRKEQEIQEQHLYTEKMEALAAFSCGIAHDINGVLQTISTCSELMAEDIPHDSILHEDIQKIQEVSHRGQGIISKLSAYSGNKQRKEDVNTALHAELTELVPQLQAQFPSCTIAYENTAQNACIALSHEEIFQLFQNICRNAVQAMPQQKGDIRLSVHAVCKAEMPEKIQNKQTNALCIRITDNGAGIAPEHLKHIFEPYFTTKKMSGNYGLGLFSLHGMIQSHGGSIEMYSERVKVQFVLLFYLVVL